MLVGSTLGMLVALGTATAAFVKPIGPDLDTDALRRRVDTSHVVTMPLQWDTGLQSWAVNISIGSQIFTVRPDFQSMDTLSLLSTYCAGLACIGQSHYSNKSAGEPYTSQNGSLLGWDFVDDVSIGSPGSASIANLTIRALAQVPPALLGSARHVSGTLPLSACTMSTSDSSDHALSLLQYTPFLSINPFAHLLGVNFDYQGGTFCPGCIDLSAVSATTVGNGSIDYWPLRADRPRSQDWQVQDMKVWLNGSVTATGVDVIISTNINGIYAPQASVDKFYESVPGAKRWSVDSGDVMYAYPCNSEPHMALQYRMVSTSWQVLPDNFNMGSVGDGSYCIGAVMSPADNSTLQFKPSDGSETIDVWMFGNSWLIEVYAVFDWINQRFGVAHKQL